MLTDENSVERYRALLATQKMNWDSFKFIIESIDETKVNMIDLLFNIISNSDLNCVCFK